MAGLKRSNGRHRQLRRPRGSTLVTGSPHNEYHVHHLSFIATTCQYCRLNTDTSLGSDSSKWIQPDPTSYRGSSTLAALEWMLGEKTCGWSERSLQMVVSGYKYYPVTNEDGNAKADHVSQGQLLATYSNFRFGLLRPSSLLP